MNTMKSQEQDFRCSPSPCHSLPRSLSSICYDYAIKPKTGTCSETKTWAGDGPGTPACPLLLEPKLERSNTLELSLDGSKDRQRWQGLSEGEIQSHFHIIYEHKILNRALGNKFGNYFSGKARSSPQVPVLWSFNEQTHCPLQISLYDGCKLIIKNNYNNHNSLQNRGL